MNTNKNAIRLTDWKVILLFLLCLAPVLWQFSETFSPPGWKSVAADVTRVCGAYRGRYDVARMCQITYKYTLAGVSYKGIANSVAINFWLSTDFNQKYSGKTIAVSYNPKAPDQTRATGVALDYTFSALMTYLAAFISGFILLTLYAMSAMSGENLEREPKQY